MIDNRDALIIYLIATLATVQYLYIKEAKLVAFAQGKAAVYASLSIDESVKYTE